ncbi:MAG: hypothetical protein ABJP79_02440 [Tateyamaria sp.]|uniref:hypothetical protein n=1 Tax=Tateyamaria sp. TaxID=1929288 RepID=UPI00329B258A
MAISRGRNPMKWGVISVLFSPIVSLFALALLGNAKGYEPSETSAQEKAKTNKYWIIGSLCVGIFVFLFFSHQELEDGVQETIESILKENNIEASVRSLNVPFSAQLGYKVEGDAFVEKGSEISRLSFTYTSIDRLPMFGGEYYVEISGVEMMNLRGF